MEDYIYEEMSHAMDSLKSRSMVSSIIGTAKSADCRKPSHYMWCFQISMYFVLCTVHCTDPNMRHSVNFFLGIAEKISAMRRWILPLLPLLFKTATALEEARNQPGWYFEIDENPKRCPALHTSPSQPRRRPTVCGQTASKTRPRLRGFLLLTRFSWLCCFLGLPLLIRGLNCSQSPCARCSGQWGKKWMIWRKKFACGSRTPGDELPDQGDGTTRAKVKPQKRKNNEDESAWEGDPHSGGCRPGRVEEPRRSQLLWSFQRRSTWPGQVDSNILQKNSRGLKKSFFCRLSLALEPNTEKMNTAPGMGLKFLRDGVDSANLVADFVDCPNQLICLTLFFCIG